MGIITYELKYMTTQWLKELGEQMCCCNDLETQTSEESGMLFQGRL